MKSKLISEIISSMLPMLDNEQLKRLKEVLEGCLNNVTIAEEDKMTDREKVDYLDIFLSAKKIEGCSDKTLIYYRNTIQQMLEGVGKSVCSIGTEDLRTYLADYQAEKESSKVTIDNIRRIFSSFFLGWKMRITL